MTRNIIFHPVWKKIICQKLICPLNRIIPVGRGGAFLTYSVTKLRVPLLEVEGGVVYPLGSGVGVPPSALPEPAELSVHLNKPTCNLGSRKIRFFF